MIISSSNIKKITLLFSIIDYLINNLVTIIENINTDIYDIKIINIVHINNEHYIDIENIQTNNIIDYKNINETDNKIYLYIINIINSHTIIDTDNIQYNITIYIFYVIIMTVETYQFISYTLINFYGFIIIVETGHPIGDVNLILYIITKEKSYVIKPVLHHKDRHHHYIQNIDDIERGASLHLERCIRSIDQMHRGCIDKRHREHRSHRVSRLRFGIPSDEVASCHLIERGCEMHPILTSETSKCHWAFGSRPCIQERCIRAAQLRIETTST